MCLQTAYVFTHAPPIYTLDVGLLFLLEGQNVIQDSVNAKTNLQEYVVPLHIFLAM